MHALEIFTAVSSGSRHQSHSRLASIHGLTSTHVHMHIIKPTVIKFYNTICSVQHLICMAVPVTAAAFYINFYAMVTQMTVFTPFILILYKLTLCFVFM